MLFISLFGSRVLHPIFFRNLLLYNELKDLESVVMEISQLGDNPYKQQGCYISYQKHHKTKFKTLSFVLYANILHCIVSIATYYHEVDLSSNCRSSGRNKFYTITMAFPCSNVVYCFTYAIQKEVLINQSHVHHHTSEVDKSGKCLFSCFRISK